MRKQHSEHTTEAGYTRVLTLSFAPACCHADRVAEQVLIRETDWLHVAVEMNRRLQLEQSYVVVDSDLVVLFVHVDLFDEMRSLR